MLKVRSHKVVIVIPGGTKPEIEILLNHLKHEANYFDECHLWLNTDSQSNITYMVKVAKKFPFVKCIAKDFKSRNNIEGIGLFTNKCTQDKIYIRLDNDICFIDKGAIKNLVKYRLKHK